MPNPPEPSTPKTVGARLKRILISRPFLIAVAALACYALAGFLLAPFLVKRYVPMFLESRLEATAAIERVRMNPFLLTAEVSEFSLASPDGRPLAGFQRFFADFQASSLFRWAWTFQQIELDRPRVNVVVEKDGRINLAAMLDRQPAGGDTGKTRDPASDDAGVPRLLLRNVTVRQGRIDVADLRQSRPAGLAIEPIDASLSNLSTLPDRKGPYTLEAQADDGASFQWSGEVHLNPLRSRGTIICDGIPAAAPWEFMRDALNLDEPEGTIRAEMAYEASLEGGRPRLSAESIAVRMKGVALRMENEAEPFLRIPEALLDDGRFDLESRTLDVGRVSVRGGSIDAGVDRGGRFLLQNILRADGAPDPGAGNAGASGPPWRLNIEAFDVADFGLGFADMSREPPARIQAETIQVALAAAATLGPETVQVRLQEIESRIGNASLGLAQESPSLVSIPVIQVSSGAFDLETRTVDVGEITLTGGSVLVVRESGGDVNLLKIAVPEKMGTVKSKRIQAIESGEPWRFAAQRVRVSDFRASVTDAVVKPDTPVLAFEGITAELANVNLQSPIEVSFSLDVVQGGRISAKGVVDPAAAAVDFAIDAADVDLTPFQPYVDPFVDLGIASGRVTSQGRLRHGVGGDGSRTGFTGSVRVDALDLVENPSGDTILGWQTLQTDDVKLGIAPNGLTVDEILLTRPSGKLLIAEDGSVNVIKLIKAPKTPDAPAPDEAGPDPGASSFPVRVGKVRILDGELDFADLSLTPPFASVIQELAGVVIGMSTETNSRAQLELEGRVDEYGAANIAGEVNTFDPKGFTDIEMAFRNVEMTRLSPYTGKFAGRWIDSGKISLDLQYRIDDSQLEGDNKIIVDRLVLGEKVDSPDAPNLPLDLAVALLQDGDGVIDIGLPVRGDLDDPEFSYGHLIWKAITNLLTKIVSAPFRALGALLGVEADSLDTVAFEAGRAGVSPPEREKLDKLAAALKQRPQLQVSVTGHYDPEHDGLALKDLQVRRELALRQGGALAPDADPGPVDFSSPAVQQSLEAWFAERFGAEALEKASAPHRSQDGSAPADPGALSKDLFGRLVAEERLAEAALETLGAQRAAAVADVLTGPEGIGADRVAAAPPAAGNGKTALGASLSLDARTDGAPAAP